MSCNSVNPRINCMWWLCRLLYRRRGAPGEQAMQRAFPAPVSSKRLRPVYRPQVHYPIHQYYVNSWRRR